jgi:hypothetical protein
MSALWHFRKGPKGIIEMHARVTGPGGLVGDMRDVIPKGWKSRRTSHAELLKAAPGVAIEERGRLRVLSLKELRKLGYRL